MRERSLIAGKWQKVSSGVGIELLRNVFCERHNPCPSDLFAVPTVAQKVHSVSQFFRRLKPTTNQPIRDIIA